jgi:cytochrome P450
MAAYIRQMYADRADNPRDDMASVLVENVQRGELTPEEYGGYVGLLFVAGNETTRNNISHGLLQLAKNPDQYELLKTGEYWDSAVEEMIRWAAPVIYMSRTATADVEYGGRQIRKGERVVLHYSAANRDPSVFENPHQFDITRDPNPHLSFGFGAHFCLGAHLARLETRCLLEQLVRRIDSFELAEPESYVRSSFISGIKRLPLSVSMAEPAVV